MGTKISSTTIGRYLTAGGFWSSSGQVSWFVPMLIWFWLFPRWVYEVYGLVMNDLIHHPSLPFPSIPYKVVPSWVTSGFINHLSIDMSTINHSDYSETEVINLLSTDIFGQLANLHPLPSSDVSGRCSRCTLADEGSTCTVSGSTGSRGWLPFRPLWWLGAETWKRRGLKGKTHLGNTYISLVTIVEW